MICYILRKKNTVILFGIGFLIGILIEILLVEKDRVGEFYYDFIKGIYPEDEPKVACVVFLKRPHTENLEAAQNTWLTKCDDVFTVRVNRAGKRRTDVEEDTRWIGLPEGEVCTKTRIHNVTAGSSWAGLCKTLHLVKTSPSNWFIFAPDNLLVLVDNLKAYVKPLDWTRDHYYGHAVQHYEADYNVFSAGVLISRGTLLNLVESFREDRCESSGKYWKNEDLYLGKHLRALGVTPKDTRDEEGRGRFHGYNIHALLSPGKLFKQSDYSRKALYPVPEGMNCCSPELITIDATNSDRLYHHYYLIYKLKTNEKPKITPGVNQNDSFDWKDFLRQEGYNETAIENMTSEEYYQIWAKKISPETLYEIMRKEFGSD
ncbi:UNVERIFIED_CONTAM: hypothetical protein PYX00_010409 [Menopon gallinae]|uniref:Uncharacterized protein n=1 Tax=Menopon gallinae TaxID=328185 RepID=A0AAW2HG47_9NEOP